MKHNIQYSLYPPNPTKNPTKNPLYTFSKTVISLPYIGFEQTNNIHQCIYGVVLCEDVW